MMFHHLGIGLSEAVKWELSVGFFFQCNVCDGHKLDCHLAGRISHSIFFCYFNFYSFHFLISDMNSINSANKTFLWHANLYERYRLVVVSHACVIVPEAERIMLSSTRYSISWAVTILSRWYHYQLPICLELNWNRERSKTKIMGKTKKIEKF